MARAVDEVTRSRILQLKERLTERLKITTLALAAAPSSGHWGGRWGPAGAAIAALRWDDGPRHRPGAWACHGSKTMRRLHVALQARRYQEFREELTRAEIGGEISEFHALTFQALLAMAEGSELASEYLEMAEAVAEAPHELAIIAEHLAAYDLLQGNSFAAADRCLATLDHVFQTEGLWLHLLIALYRLGELETIDATLQSFTELNDECTARIIQLVSSEPELHDVRARPAFRELLGRRAAG